MWGSDLDDEFSSDEALDRRNSFKENQIRPLTWIWKNIFSNPLADWEGIYPEGRTLAAVVPGCLTLEMSLSYILVTGATGFIGAHVVDSLLSRGFRVRGATRSMTKGQAMIDSRPKFKTLLDFVQIDDFDKKGVFKDAVKDVDGVIHVASPFTYDTRDNEKELIIPAINGVRSILEAATNTHIKRVVITSSFASVVDINRKTPPYFTYTAAEWNPLTYEEAIDPKTSAVVAYRGSKKFAELEAWSFVKEKKPQFDIVTLCPPMTFGPVVHPVSRVQDLNESNAMLWKVASGEELPVARVPFWIDVRDLAEAHVEALLRPEAGNERFTPASPERFSYSLAAKIILREFPWAKGQVKGEPDQPVDNSHGLDGETVTKVLGVQYRTFKETVTDLVSQAYKMNDQPK